MERIKSVEGREIPVHENFLKTAEQNPTAAEKLCPACGRQGVRVLPVTIATHVDAKYWNLISDGYYFSLTPECPVTYYNNSKRIYFLKDEIKTRFGIKETEPPRPICYCLQVTEEMIADEILNKRCCYSLQDIEAYTKAGTGKWCLTTNPSGKCCREYLGEVVEKYLRMAGDEAVRKAILNVKESLKEPLKRVELEVKGMTCESCTVAVKAIIENLGGREVSVSLREGKATALIPIHIKPEEVSASVSDSGYVAYVKKVEHLQ